MNQFINPLKLIITDFFPQVNFSWLKKRRLPVLLQLNTVECGVACLAMVLNYYGHKVTVSECRMDFGLSRDGISAKDILKVARFYGLETGAYYADINQLQHLPLPAIAYWERKHFIVLEAIRSHHIHIIDPEHGRKILSWQEFRTGYSEVTLTFKSTQKETLPHHPGTLLSLSSYFKSILTSKKIFPILLQLIGLTLFVQILGLIGPYLTRFLIDDIASESVSLSFPILSLGLLALLFSQFLVQYGRGRLLVWIQVHLERVMLNHFFRHLLKLPFHFFQLRTSGDLLTRFDSNNVIRDMLTNRSISLVLDSFFVIVYLVILFGVHFKYSLIVITLGFIQIIFLIFSLKKLYILNEQSVLAQSHTQSYLVEVLRNILHLKASGAEEIALELWSSRFEKQLNMTTQRNHFNNLMGSLMATFRYMSPLILLSIGIIWVIEHQISLGTLLALNALAAAFLTPLVSIVVTGQQLQWAVVHLNRIADILRATPEQHLQKVEKVEVLSGELSVKNLSFRYNNQATYILKDVSFSMQAGQSIAIVGPTGSGKSTLALLLAGLYEAKNGIIEFDEKPLPRLDYHSLRQHMGIVLQEVSLFNGSIRDNIALNKPFIKQEAIQKAAQIACIHEEIMQMPLQYNTEILEGGAGLSGGQKQRIALARAIAHDPKILILDEATSHLDVETEHRVITQLEKLNITRISIAHRLSTIRNADCILVLNQGQLVEQGNHEQLMKQGSFYYHVIKHQVGTNSV